MPWWHRLMRVVSSRCSIRYCCPRGRPGPVQSTTMMRTNKKECTNLHKHRARTSFWLRNYSINGKNGKMCASRSSSPWPVSPTLYHFIAYLMQFSSFSSPPFSLSTQNRAHDPRYQMRSSQIIFRSEFTTQLSLHLACVRRARTSPFCHDPIPQFIETMILLRLQFSQCFHIDARAHGRNDFHCTNMNEKCSPARETPLVFKLSRLRRLARIVVWRVRALLPSTRMQTDLSWCEANTHTLTRRSSPNPYRNAMVEFRARLEFPLQPPSQLSGGDGDKEVNLICLMGARRLRASYFFTCNFLPSLILRHYFAVAISHQAAAFFWSTPFTFFVLWPPRTAIFKTQK